MPADMWVSGYTKEVHKGKRHGLFILSVLTGESRRGHNEADNREYERERSLCSAGLRATRDAVGGYMAIVGHFRDRKQLIEPTVVD